jgi:hypothetical protein
MDIAINLDPWIDWRYVNDGPLEFDMVCIIHLMKLGLGARDDDV